MKRKRSVRMITKLLILSLILGLCLPSFTYQVKADEEEYILNFSARVNAGLKYTNAADVSLADADKKEFTAVAPNIVGNEKYVLFYGATTTSDKLTRGFVNGMNIPLKESETGWTFYNKKNQLKKGWSDEFKGYSFESGRLNWNFSENAASDQMFIVTNTTQKRIPIYVLGAHVGDNFGNVAYTETTPVTSEAVKAVNESMRKLYSLVDTIESQSDKQYYPEHAEMLKEVSCEIRNILVYHDGATYDSTFFFPENEKEWRESSSNDYGKWKNQQYGVTVFAGIKKIIDGYVDYVEKHKIATPTIESAKIGDTEARIDNKNHKIVLPGQAEDYTGRQLKELEITLSDGLTGSWNGNDGASLIDTDLIYRVWPYNENLGIPGKETYKELGQGYQIQIGEVDETYEPDVRISPENLNGVKTNVTSYTDEDKKETTYTVSASGKTTEVTDPQGQHYAFSHWELDEANQELESAIRYSDYVTRKVHNSIRNSESFIMPSNPLTMTAVYKSAYRITEENEGLNEGTTFELSSVDAHFSGWNPEDSEVELYYYDRTVPKGYLVKEVHVSTNAGTQVESTLSSKSNINYIRFTMPSDDVKVTVIFEKDNDNERKLTLGEPSGTLIAGKGGTATYELTAEGYSEDATFTAVESYNTGIAKDPVTEGLAVALGKVTAGKGTITVTVAPEVAADEYYFCVTPSEGKLLPVGTITVLPADTKMLKAEDASITLKENESGEVKIKGSSMNLSAGASVEAFETDQDGQIKYSGKTEGLTFDKAVLNNDAFTLTAYVSKTVEKGEYYFIVKADNEQSAVAKLTVDREKAETPDQPDQPEKETQKITVTSNASQGSIQIKVAGGSEELISGTGTVKAVEGDTVTVTAVPKDGHKLSVWKITQGMKDVALSSGSLSDTSVSFVMPAASGSDTVTVGATFDKTYTDPVVTSEPKITAFSVANVSGTIDQNSGTITVVVPNGTDVTSLCPAIATSDADSVTPASGAAVDFTNAVTYTVKNASGAQKSYVVTVKVQEASVSDTLWDKITSPEGDRSWWKKADSIKNHKKNKYPKYW